MRVSLLLCRYLSGSTLIQDSIQSLGVGPDMQLSDMPEHGEQTVRTGLLHWGPSCSDCQTLTRGYLFLK